MVKIGCGISETPHVSVVEMDDVCVYGRESVDKIWTAAFFILSMNKIIKLICII